jgi:hypothetical protein
MEGLTRLVAESLARHGFDRPVDYRRLHWSRWFHCESPHSLLCVPSKPGVFALAEEVIAPGVASSGATNREGHEFSRAAKTSSADPALAAEVSPGVLQGKRMLAVVQFGEDEDMAFVLDRMFALQNPMRARLASGRCFVRFVVIEDAAHRRSIAGALNQWLVSSGEKASGIGAHFASSLELTPAAATNRMDTTTPVEAGGPSANADARVGRTLSSVNASRAPSPAQADPLETAVDCRPASENAPAAQIGSGAATNIHCPQPLPSGF